MHQEFVLRWVPTGRTEENMPLDEGVVSIRANDVEIDGIIQRVWYTAPFLQAGSVGWATAKEPKA